MEGQWCPPNGYGVIMRVLSHPAALLLISLSLLNPALRGEETKSRSATNLRRTQTVEVVDRIKACVVNIHSERTVTDLRSLDKNPDVALTQHRVNGMGTGIVIDPRGYLITNQHVVDDVQLLRVRLHDGTTLPARIIARDPEQDLAIIKIDPLKPLPVIPLGTSSDLMLGEPVIAIGNAFGYEHTVTTGIVSALKRDVTLNKEVSYKSLIQTSAGINPGNSGGPLLNVHGELVGVNVAIRAGAQNIAFALPIDNVLKTTSEMLSSRKKTGLTHGMIVRDMVDHPLSPNVSITKLNSLNVVASSWSGPDQTFLTISTSAAVLVWIAGGIFLAKRMKRRRISATIATAPPARPSPSSASPNTASAPPGST